MDLIDLLIVIIIAVVCGTVAQVTSRHSRGGWIVNCIFGLFGALLGTYLARYFRAPDIFNLKIGLTNFPTIWSLLGAALFVALIGFFVKGRNF